ncbi:10287_t:CDS:1, partial [Gigaspora rosea]
IESYHILLEHLNKVSQGEPYNPPNLKELSGNIAEDYFQYLNKKAELQRELEKKTKRLNSRTR